MLRSALPSTPHRSPRSLRAAARPLGSVTVALAFIVTLLTGYGAAPTSANAASSVGLLSSSAKPRTAAVASRAAVNLGVKFSTSTDGTVTALQFYRSTKQKSAYAASLWDSRGKRLATATFKKSSKAGWQTAMLAKPVGIKMGKTYTASYLASDGRFAVTRGAFAANYTKSGLSVVKKGGVYRYSKKSLRPNKPTASNYLVDIVFTVSTTAARTPTPSVTPTPTPTPAPTVPASGWPNAGNTGVPSGVTLTAYTGPSTITADNTVISNRVVNGGLNIRAANVQIINSRINGSIDLRDPKTANYSFTITDSEVHVGDNLNTGIMRGNFRATRVEVTGGRRSIYCAYNCVVEDSWVHLQGGDPGGDAHFSGVRMEQNGTFRHNTLVCEAARGSGTGCSAALTGYGDFAPVQNNLIENNRFVGSLGGGATMCAYGGSSGADGGKPYGNQARDIRFINNVFTRGTTGKCGNLGAVAHFDPTRPGNAWTGNTWDDGTTIRYTD